MRFAPGERRRLAGLGGGLLPEEASSSSSRAGRCAGTGPARCSTAGANWAGLLLPGRGPGHGRQDRKPSGEEMAVAIGDPGEILGDMTVLDQAPRRPR